MDVDRKLIVDDKQKGLRDSGVMLNVLFFISETKNL